ncbi:MAG: type IV secretory system conjugative DNA transfer family protein, partial [Ruminococcus sp.]|nr:type IV secretory system conjugative DNA transfer family protein [Ruminococcus sp.]
MEEKKDRRPIVRLLQLVFFSIFYFIAINSALNYLIITVRRLGTGIKYGTKETLPFQLSYLYTAPAGFDWYMAVLAALVLAILTVIKLDQMYMIKHGNETTKGKSRWLEIKELDKLLYSFPCDKMESAEKSGIILALENGRYYIDPQTIHSLIIGTTRSGKGQTFVLPMIRHIGLSKSKHSMVMNDPKGELLENTYDILTAHGYNVVVLNLRDTELSSLWNPLQIIIDEYVYARDNSKDLSKVIKLVSSLSDTFTHNDKSDPIWPESARSLLIAMILLMLQKGYETDNLDKVSLYSVYQMFIDFGTKNERRGNENVNALDELFKDLAEKEPTSPAVSAYAVSNFASGEMRSSIFSTLASNINIFGSDTGISKLTSGNQIHFKDLADPQRPTAVFMVVPDHDTSRHVIASLFVNQCYNSLVEYASTFQGQKLPQRVHFILDEFGNMVRIPDMDTKITVGAGRNLLFDMFIQDLNQLDTKYDNAAKTIRSNCGNMIYINSLDKETNEYFSAILGNRTNEYTTYSGSVSTWLDHQSQAVDGQALMSADDLAVLPIGSAVTKRQRCYPIKTKLKPFYELNIKPRMIPDIAKSMEIIDKPLEETIFPMDILWEPLFKPKLERDTGRPLMVVDENGLASPVTAWNDQRIMIEKRRDSAVIDPLRPVKAPSAEKLQQVKEPEMFRFPDPEPES